jgi:hypothetical protein
MNKKLFLALIIIGVLTAVLAGCTSVPEVKNVKMAGPGKYDVVVDRDYMDDPKEFDYAINSFVKEKGGTSYDIEQYGSNDFYITIPGSTEVKDLPEVKHLHKGKTVGLVLGITIPVVVITVIAVVVRAWVNAWNNTTRY